MQQCSPWQAFQPYSPGSSVTKGIPPQGQCDAQASRSLQFTCVVRPRESAPATIAFAVYAALPPSFGYLSQACRSCLGMLWAWERPSCTVAAPTSCYKGCSPVCPSAWLELCMLMAQCPRKVCTSRPPQICMPSSPSPQRSGPLYKIGCCVSADVLDAMVRNIELEYVPSSGQCSIRVI